MYSKNYDKNSCKKYSANYDINYDDVNYNNINYNDINYNDIKYDIKYDVNYDKKECNYYENFFLISNENIYFHPNFSLEIDDKIIKQILECKMLRFLNNIKYIEEINPPDANLNIFNKIKSHCKICNERWKYSIFNQPIDLTQCVKLKSIYFGQSFNQPIDNKLPQINILVFGNDFNQPINMLPDTLEILEFANSFNQPIKKLPVNLIKVKFGFNFNQKLICLNEANNCKSIYLPESLKYLEFGTKYKYYMKYFPIALNVTFCYNLL